MQAVIYLGHGLGLQVVAEGVEHERHWQMLKSLGCDRVQGYLFRRPLSVPDLERRVAEFAAQPPA